MRRNVTILALIAGLVGCGGAGKLNGTSSSSSTATAPVTSGSPSPSPSPNPSPSPSPSPTPSFASVAAVLNAKGKSAAKGDTLTVTFAKEVKLSGSDPTKDFQLLVAGDTFGVGATMTVGAKPVDVVITLGDKPQIRVSGKFDKRAVIAGDPSGVDVSATTTITDLQGNKASSNPIDVDGALVPSMTAAAPLQQARGDHTATLLDDGRILVVGGLTTTPQGPAFVQESEIYDPLANTFTKTSDPSLGGQNGYMLVPTASGQMLPVARVFHTATKLPGGKVLIAAGFGFERLDPATGQPVQEDLKTAHVFDPKTNQFTLVQNTLTLARSSHYATLLSNGKVLIAGGFNGTLNGGKGATLPAAEIFDPTAGTFTALSTTGQDMTVPRQDGVAVGLAARKSVLFSGGIAIAQPSGATAPQVFLSGAAEAFDETASKFAATKGKPANDLRGQAGVLLADAVAVLGGDQGKTPSAAIELYDPKAGTFSTAKATLKTARSRSAGANAGSLQASVAGGTNLSGSAGHEQKSIEIFDEAAGAMSSIDMANARNGCTATRIAGAIVIIGGFNGDNGQSALSLGGTPVAAAEKLLIP